MTIIARNIAIIIALGALMSATALAQDIHTEVDVKYNETLQLREVSKLNVPATLNLPTEKTTQMPYSTADVRIGVPSSITTLEPVSYGDTIYTSPYRGYAALGFMPMYNAALSAGYKILDTDRSRLNAWMQYDGATYKGDMMPISLLEKGVETYVRRHALSLGATLHQAVASQSFIDAGVDYTYAHYNTPTFVSTHNQGVHRFNASVLWTHRHGGFTFGAGAEYGHFAYVNGTGYGVYVEPGSRYPENPMRENHFQFNGMFSGKFWGASAAGINLSLSHNSYEPNFDMSPISDGVAFTYMGQHRLTTLSLNPYYRFDISQFKLDLGAQIDLTFNAGEVLHIAPKVEAVWLPSDIFRLYVKATGGTWANTLGSLYEVTPYAVPYQSMRNSQIPLDAEVGVKVGPYKGFYAEISASYAFAKDWVMPQMETATELYGVSSGMIAEFGTVDIKGYKLHGAAGYNWKNIVDVKASIDIAPQDFDKGYYLWRDRAKTVVSAHLRVTPIKPLDIELSWEYRGSRAITAIGAGIETPDEGIGSAGGSLTPLATETIIPNMSLRSLGSVNNLTVGALYRINSQWSGFLRGENLLNRKNLLIGGMPSQGITGLIGVSYKF